MKILLSGDIHSYTGALQRVMYHAQNNNVDRVFFLGDFGYNFTDNFIQIGQDLADETGLMVEFIDGNHENFDRLYSFPIADDGYRYLSDNVRHIPRGTVLNLDGHHVLCMGGATSIDRQWRKEGESWWSQEAITDEQVELALENCQGKKIDAMFCHDSPILPDRGNKAFLGGFIPEEDIKLSDDNRDRIAKLVLDLQPQYLYHGHHHVRHDDEFHGCQIRGLGMQNHANKQLMLMVDTDEDWN